MSIILGVLASVSEPGEEVANYAWRYGTALSQWLLVLNLALSLACFASAIEAFPSKDGFDEQSYSRKAVERYEKADVASESKSIELSTAPHAATRCTVEAVHAAATSLTERDHQALLHFCQDAGLNTTHHAM